MIGEKMYTRIGKLWPLTLTLVIAFLASATASAQGRRFKVRIESTPPHATVYVDDTAGGIKGYTPTRLRLSKGTHKIFVVLDGYEPQEQFVTVKRKTAPVTFELRKLVQPGTLKFTPAKEAMAGAEVSVDGRNSGKLPCDLKLNEGRHLVEITLSGFEKWTRWFEVKQGEVRDVAITLNETKIAPGELHVTCEPPVEGAVVFVDNQEKGPAPWSGEVPPGEHTVGVRAKDYKGTIQTASVVSGQPQNVIVPLSKDVDASRGTLLIAADPPLPDAFVLIDGKKYGAGALAREDGVWSPCGGSQSSWLRLRTRNSICQRSRGSAGGH